MAEQGSPRTVILVTVILGFVLIAVGGISIISYHLAISDAKPVDATIIHSGVETRTGDGRGERKGPNVVYEFSCGGTTERGEGVFAGAGPATWPTRTHVRAVADRYEEGENVTAYVVQYNEIGLHEDECEGGTFLVGEGPRFYAYIGFVLVGAYFTWAGVGLWLSRRFGLDVPLRIRLDDDESE